MTPPSVMKSFANRPLTVTTTMGSRRGRRDETGEHDNKRCRLGGPASEASSSQIDAESLLGAAEGLTRMVTHCGDYSSMAGTSEAREQRDVQDEPSPDKPAPFLKKLALMLRTNEYSQLVRWDGLNEERGTQTFVVLDAVRRPPSNRYVVSSRGPASPWPDRHCHSPSPRPSIPRQVEFAKSLLPLFFKHNKLSSFVQQLYTYGFRRVDSLDLLRQPSNDPLLSSEQPKRLTFEHEVFMPSDAGVLVSIKRRLKGPPRGSSGLEAAGEFGEGDEMEHALLLNDELAALETQIDELRRSQSAREQLDLQRLDSLWHMAQVRLLSQSHMWRGVMAAAKDDDPPVCPAPAMPATRGAASSGALPSGLPVRAAHAPCRVASPQPAAWSSASPQPAAWGAWAPPNQWTPPPTCTAWQEAAAAPSGLQAPRVDPQLLSALLARAAALPEEAKLAAEAFEAAAAAAAAAVAAEVSSPEAATPDSDVSPASQGTDLASISLASMASRMASRMASPGRDIGSEEATEQQHSSSHSSSSANGGEGSGHGGRSRDGSVDGDGGADSSPDEAEAAAGLRLFGIERASRPFMQPTGSQSVDI